MAQSKVVSDLQAVRDLGGIICWQEISRDRYKQALRAEFTLDGGWANEHLDREIPISYRTQWWEAVDRGCIRTHESRPLVTPERFVTWVQLKRRDSDDTLVVVNTHYVSSAWNRKPVLAKQWRKAKWLEHWQAQKDLILGFHANGLTVIGGGDFNRPDVPTFHKDMQWFTGHTIDKLFVLRAPRGLHLKAVDLSVKEGLNTDHRPRILRLART